MDEVKTERPKDLDYYASQSDITDPRDMADLLANLPYDIAGLRRVAQGLVIHYRSRAVIEYGIPAERIREIDTRYANRMLARIRELKDGPLTVPRSPMEKLVGCCRDFTVLFVAMARAQGIPSRSRIGFASYFSPGYWIDHVVAEVWDADEGRWRLIDPQLVDNYKSPDGKSVDPLNLPPDKFLLAGSAWKQCRAGLADPEIFVVSPDLELEKTRGWAEIYHNMVHDLAALNKTEMLLWDEWSKPWEALVEADLDRLDKVADKTTVKDLNVDELLQVYKNDSELKVPNTVLSEDPLGGPCRNVSWLRQYLRVRFHNGASEKIVLALKSSREGRLLP